MFVADLDQPQGPPPPNGAPVHDFVFFYMSSLQNEAKSLEAGRPIFDDVEFIKIAIPGDKSNIVEKPVTQFIRERYQRQYQAWKAGNQESGLSGTPLSAWPLLSRSQAAELNYFNVRTVEQLAAMSDEVSQKFPGSTKLRQQAKDFVAQAEGNAPLLKMRAELELRDNEIDTLKRQVKELMEMAAEKKAKGK